MDDRVPCVVCGTPTEWRARKHGPIDLGEATSAGPGDPFHPPDSTMTTTTVYACRDACTWALLGDYDAPGWSAPSAVHESVTIPWDWHLPWFREAEEGDE